MPYEGNGATVKRAGIYPSGRLLVVASPTMQVSGDGLESGGQQQGMNIYGREGVAANTVIAVSVSGTAPPLPAEGSEAGRGPGGQEAAQAAPPANLHSAPGRQASAQGPTHA